MRNQPHSQWQLIDSSADRRDDAWNLDRQAELRPWIIGFLILTVALGISLRLYDLKQYHQADFLKNANPVTQQREKIPAVDGRIYSSDGLLLAYDHQRFSLAVHYRWLESPPDEKWWKQQARARLSRKQWSDPQAMAEARQAVLEKQNQLWKRLAELTGQTSQSLAEKRKAIQQRVERISDSVQKRHEEKLARESAELPARSADSRWESIWQLVVQELTEPPRRESRDPIIIQEELDYHEIVAQVSTAIVAEIEAHPHDYPGVQTLITSQRIYPQADLASHVIGNRTPVRADQLEARQKDLQAGDPLSYEPGDRKGRFGVERSYDVALHGLPGSRELTRNRRGEVVQTQLQRTPRSGQQLILTINSQLQRTAEELLDQQIPPQPSLLPPLPAGTPGSAEPPTGGCILVMNIYSGELLAAAAAPRPDLARMTSGETTYWKQLTTDPRSPLLSRLTQVTQAPGSTFKPLTAVALCETEGIPQQPFDCQGFLDTPESHRCAIFRSTGMGHGSISLTDALARSCNVYFFAAARRMGPQPLVDWARRFGFGEVTGVDLPFEQAGHVPAPADNSPDSPYHWYPGDNLGLSIGQSYLSVTPLQMLRMTAAIANGGELVTPVIVSRVIAEESHATGMAALSPETHLPPQTIAVSQQTLSIIRQGMEQTVASPQGTAYGSVRSGQVKIAGKTGTAQTGLNRPNHAWFIGYAPAQSPQYAFVVLLERGGAGGEQAGPLARQVVEKLVSLGLIDKL